MNVSACMRNVYHHIIAFPYNYTVGGETIREINRQSGAYVELQRGPAANPNEKIFNVRGDNGQIQHAIQMIADKAGMVSCASFTAAFNLYCTVSHGY